MLSKGVPFFLLMNIIIYDLSGSTLIQDLTKEPYRSHRRSYLSDNSYKNHMPVEIEQLLLAGSTSRTRNKRGIVLIDEDFDKLPDVSVRQSWSGENTVSDITKLPDVSVRRSWSGESTVPDIVTYAFKESEKDSPMDEGSGSSTIAQNSTIEFSITPGELQITKEKSKLTSLLETTIEGSGDDDFTSKPTESEEIIKDDFFLMCSNFTCDAHEIKILPGFAESLSEDSTLILTCSTMNFSSGDLLQWYKSNGSDNFQLETSLVKNQLQFAIPKVKLEDSGKYLCLRLSKQTCCHKQLDVTVYKKPNYKFHLLIIGLVTVGSLFVCLLLGIHRRYKLKKFKKQLKTQIPLNEFLL